MANYNRGKNFKKNTKKNSRSAYVKDKVNVMNNMYPSLNDEPLDSYGISEIVMESLSFKRTYVIYKNLDPNKVVLYFHYLTVMLAIKHREEKLTKLSALTWISEYLDVMNRSTGDLEVLLEQLMVELDAMVELEDRL